MSDSTAVSLRRTLFAGLLVGTSLFGDSYLYAVLPVHYAAAGISVIGIGWVLSTNRWIRFLTNPLAGRVGPAIGWSLAFALSLWLGAAMTLSYALLSGLLLFMLGRALWGLGWSFLRLGGTAAVLADSPPGRRGRLMGLFTGAFRLGSLLAVVGGGYLADHWGYRPTLLLLAAGSAAGAIVASLPPALQGRWGAPARETAKRQALSYPLLHSWLPLGSEEWGACLAVTASEFTSDGLVTATLGYLISQRFGQAFSVGGWLLGAATFTGLVLGTRWAVTFIIGPSAGHLADRLGRRLILGIAVSTAIAGLLGMAVAPRPILVALAALVTFVSATAMTTSADAWAGDLAGKAPGRFLPTYNSWTDLGAALGPIIGYSLVAWLGLPLTYTLGAALLALLWLGQWTMVRQRALAR